MAANVLAYGYQVVQARLLKPEEYAALTALFGILILESVSSQVIQSATATLAARYRARDEEAHCMNSDIAEAVMLGDRRRQDRNDQEGHGRKHEQFCERRCRPDP